MYYFIILLCTGEFVDLQVKGEYSTMETAQKIIDGLPAPRSLQSHYEIQKKYKSLSIK